MRDIRRTVARRVASVLMIASASCLGATAGHARPGCDAIVFFDAGFKGQSQEIHDDQAFVGPHWNDQISSIVVRAGHWEFYWDAGFRGEMLRYGPGEYPFVGQHWNDQISSMRCVADDAGEQGSDVFVDGGQSYGWFEDGWNGPGFYVRGSEHRHGRGFGGRDGFHGRHHDGGRPAGGGGGHHDGGGAHHGGGGRPSGGGGHHGGGGGHHGGGGGGGQHPGGGRPGGGHPGGGHPGGGHPGGGHPGGGRPGGGHPGGGHRDPHRH